MKLKEEVERHRPSTQMLVKTTKSLFFNQRREKAGSSLTLPFFV
jgi:hypothetical protein